MGEAVPYVRRTKRRPSITRRARFTALACLVLALVLALAGLALKQQEIRQAAASEAASFTPAPIKPAAKLDSALFIGDSYTAGARAQSPDQSWALIAGRNLSWNPTTSADSGSGYLTKGQGGDTTQTLIEAVKGSDPQHVVIASGYNDSLSDPDAFTTAVNAAFDSASKQWPDAQIIILGPWVPNDTLNENQTRARDILRASAESHGFAFVDPSGWLDPGLVDADGIHPNPEGHRQLGQKAADAIAGTL